MSEAGEDDPLRELARRAYPGARVMVEYDDRTALVWRDGVPVVKVGNHPKALRGLEACLRALADD